MKRRPSCRSCTSWICVTTSKSTKLFARKMKTWASASTKLSREDARSRQKTSHSARGSPKTARPSPPSTMKSTNYVIITSRRGIRPAPCRWAAGAASRIASLGKIRTWIIRQPTQEWSNPSRPHAQPTPRSSGNSMKKLMREVIAKIITFAATTEKSWRSYKTPIGPSAS